MQVHGSLISKDWISSAAAMLQAQEAQAGFRARAILCMGKAAPLMAPIPVKAEVGPPGRGSMCSTRILLLVGGRASGGVPGWMA